MPFQVACRLDVQGIHILNNLGIVHKGADSKWFDSYFAQVKYLCFVLI